MHGPDLTAGDNQAAWQELLTERGQNWLAPFLNADFSVNEPLLKQALADACTRCLRQSAGRAGGSPSSGASQQGWSAPRKLLINLDKISDRSSVVHQVVYGLVGQELFTFYPRIAELYAELKASASWVHGQRSKCLKDWYRKYIEIEQQNDARYHIAAKQQLHISKSFYDDLRQILAARSRSFDAAPAQLQQVAINNQPPLQEPEQKRVDADVEGESRRTAEKKNYRELNESVEQNSNGNRRSLIGIFGLKSFVHSSPTQLITGAVKKEQASKEEARQHGIAYHRILNIVAHKFMSEVYGIRSDRACCGVMHPSAGESLFELKQNIKSIQAFIRLGAQAGGVAQHVRQFLRTDFLPITMMDNRKLPPWLNVLDTANRLVLYGTPTETLEGGDASYVIDILDKNDFILREFEVAVRERPTACLTEQ